MDDWIVLGIIAFAGYRQKKLKMGLQNAEKCATV